MPISIQYIGFHVQPHGRDYAYYVLDPPSASRRFTVTISHQAFAERHILYQDAPDLCYQKLQRAILAETEERPLLWSRKNGHAAKQPEPLSHIHWD